MCEFISITYQNPLQTYECLIILPNYMHALGGVIQTGAFLHLILFSPLGTGEVRTSPLGAFHPYIAKTQTFLPLTRCNYSLSRLHPKLCSGQAVCQSVSLSANIRVSLSPSRPFCIPSFSGFEQSFLDLSKHSCREVLV